MTQPKPIQIEIYRQGAVSDLAAGYQTVQKDGDAIIARATIRSLGQAGFDVEDRWTINGAVLSLSRRVSVSAGEENAGFYSAIHLSTPPFVKWGDMRCLIPGLLYGDSSHAGGSVPSSAANDRARHFTIREDYMSAPLLGLSFTDGNWAAVLDPRARRHDPGRKSPHRPPRPLSMMCLQFGALGAVELPNGGIDLGFWLPGTTIEAAARACAAVAGEPAVVVRPERPARAQPMPRRVLPAVAPDTVRRRYNPVKAGFSQTYQVAFRFDKLARFPAHERDAWRWAWQSLNPKVIPIDVAVAQRTLIDHLSSLVATVDGRTGIPFEYSAVDGSPINLTPKIIMGFCGKNIEGADQLLQEGDRDQSHAAGKMGQQGLDIIDSLVRLVPMCACSIRRGVQHPDRGSDACQFRPWFSRSA